MRAPYSRFLTIATGSGLDALPRAHRRLTRLAGTPAGETRPGYGRAVVDRRADRQLVRRPAARAAGACPGREGRGRPDGDRPRPAGAVPHRRSDPRPRRHHGRRHRSAR
ncbi:hypothetical protein FXF52_16420 [Micromonospora sp. MP36]|nr:hypothetical protein FXF52_16420 [Micromonospora sp. MP36]